MRIVKKSSTNCVWILGGGLMQSVAVREAKKLGYKTIVTDKNKNCICSKKSDYFFQIDIFNIKEHIKLAKKIRKKINIKSIFLCGIDCTVTGAKLANFLNLPHCKIQHAKLTNNKYLFRIFQKKNNFFYPKFTKIYKDDINNLFKKIKNLKFPIIIKNVDNSASRGTFIFKKKPSLELLKEKIFDGIKFSRCNYCIVEEYFTGSEHTVETFYNIYSNQVKCFITDRFFDHKKGYALETGLRSPSSLSKKKQETLFKLIDILAKKMGLNFGPLKADILYTKKGPMIIEATTRYSGGFDCQFLVPAASGKNIVRAGIQNSLGKKVNETFLKDRFNLTGVTGSLWPKKGQIKKIDFNRRISNMRGFKHLFFVKKIGEKVGNYKNCADRACFIIAVGKNFNQAKKNLDNIGKKISIETYD